jgi:hypothetical protein
MTRTIHCPDCGHLVNVSSRPYHGPEGEMLRISVHRPTGGSTCPGSGRAVDCIHCGREHDFAGELCAGCGRPPFAELPSSPEGAMEGRGGKREGAGRPAREGGKGTRLVSTRLNDPEGEKFDAIARAKGTIEADGQTNNGKTILAAVELAHRCLENHRDRPDDPAAALGLDDADLRKLEAVKKHAGVESNAEAVRAALEIAVKVIRAVRV